MMRASIVFETNYYILCPHCNKKHDQNIKYFIDQQIKTFGPWVCDYCFGTFKGTVIDANIEIEPLDKKAIPTLHLLKIPATDGDVFFIVFTAYEHHTQYSLDELNSTTEYFYNEHTCPTNWLKGVELICQNGDTDPHGVAQHVRSVRVPDYSYENYHDNTEKWFEIFPELLKEGSVVQNYIATLSQRKITWVYPPKNVMRTIIGRSCKNVDKM